MAKHEPPTVLVLLPCEQAVIEERTHNITLVNTFRKYRVERFPSPPCRIVVFAALTNGLGQMSLELVIQRLDTFAEIVRLSRRFQLNDPLEVIRLLFRVRDCIFPVPGSYQITLLADGAPLSQYPIRVFQ